MELSIIIVNWNAVDYVHNCIASIYKYTKDITFEIIVVDNASTKGNIDSLKASFPDVKIIKSKQNLGFARANNLAFRQANGVHILFLNPDTKLVGPAINIMLDSAKSLPNAGIIGCKQVNPDLTVQTTSVQKFPTILNQILNIEALRLRWPSCPLWNIAPLFCNDSKPVVVDVIPGACMLLRRKLFEDVGMFSEEYFMYAEDIDLNYKVARTGLKNYYVPGAVIIHYGGRSSAQKRVNQWATIMKYRSMGKYYSKNYGRLYAATFRMAMGLCAFFRLVAIGMAFPFGMFSRNSESFLSAAHKWCAVFKWSVGLADRCQ